MAKSSRSVLWLVVLLRAVSGCAHVAPYQRGRLVHPTLDPADAHSAGRDHVRAVHEGAIGGGLAAEAGCGCN